MAKRHFFIIGDSISVHYGPYLKAMLSGWIDYGRADAGSGPLVNEGETVGGNGGDSRKVLAFLLAEQSRGVRYDILLVNCGLHDIKVDPQNKTINVSLEEYERNLRYILRIAREISNETFWVRSTPVEDERHNTRVEEFKRYSADATAYNQAADVVMASLGVPTIDLHAFTRNLGPDIWLDHVHYTDQARALQAAFIAGYLLSRP